MGVTSLPDWVPRVERILAGLLDGASNIHTALDLGRAASAGAGHGYDVVAAGGGGITDAAGSAYTCHQAGKQEQADDLQLSPASRPDDEHDAGEHHPKTA